MAVAKAAALHTTFLAPSLTSTSVCSSRPTAYLPAVSLVEFVETTHLPLHPGTSGQCEPGIRPLWVSPLSNALVSVLGPPELASQDELGMARQWAVDFRELLPPAS